MTPMTQRHQVIAFHQFGSARDDDLLLLFAAPARAIVSWAGIPRKGWRVRMLYQRWVTQGREREVKAFWDDAARYQGERHAYLLGPTALTLAATQPLDLTDEGLSLSYQRPFAVEDSEFQQIEKAAQGALATILPRLTPSERHRVEQLSSDVTYAPTEYESNQVLNSAIQISQLTHDAEGFCTYNEIDNDGRSELLEALEALCRPALVVDGQHRLLGAALSEHTVTLPAVLIPRASWLDQIYQFVVINETARRVQSDLLTDIFGNSLTPDEQSTVRQWLQASHIQVESRIAAVVAGTHPDSPFKDLVKLQLGKNQVAKGYITEITVRQLIEGGRGGTPGWRGDPDFYSYYVKHTFPDFEEWQSWTAGRWREYWFAFWSEVADYYNSTTREYNRVRGEPVLLWGPVQTNLTKAVTLRLMQELFITISIEEAKAAEKAAESLRGVLSGRVADDEIGTIIEAEIRKATIPANLDEFRRTVRENFLARGVPVRVFEKKWVSSLDDESGINDLRLELRKAFELTSKGERYRAQNKSVFSVEDRD